ncbi:glucan biosynthesis protein [Coralloluteibacterium stylophorae]|uniref:Glucans biosynthesis protein D n=1 Tax=Coralloluteibacterium stylophorae TaxID=1776034 RepID=A0A8J7VVC5_9GAMM|nr:glucan biosynthesis protein D [Coralloluteibacterium stylophorae]MBS7456438.1 glucan biosynthesis protein D [Coralloluteibacterium stylophorae]
MRRRDFLQASAALLAFLQLPAHAQEADASLRFRDDGVAFDHAALKGRARALAQAPFRQRPTRITQAMRDMSWDAYQSIHYDRAHALWADAGLHVRAQFFHLGRGFTRPVRIFEVAAGRARELAYGPGMFDYGSSGLDRTALPDDLGFAGFRVNLHTDPVRDVVAFLGASYFRAVGGEWQYGLSARGLAVDTGLPRDEEFPEFTEFYLERPAPGSRTLVVHALLDSPSIAGAYRFAITPGATLTMDVDAALYPRRSIERLGIAPLTSMYQAGENDRRMANDWRPEIHDSDGLAMHTGAGEWIWRPLVNPRELRFNAFADTGPRGFGLLQRDRDFDHYQDDGVFYDRRPSLWIEPRGDWGAGSVQLVEIPTPDETLDNIVAFWNPAAPVTGGEELLYAYRMHWGGRTPAEPPLAQAVATRTGIGGVIGVERTYYSRRFAVDLAGGDLALLTRDTPVEPVITLDGGRVETVSARPLDAIDGYRVMFDLVPDPGRREQITVRMFLRAGGQPLSETWLYQFSPPPEGAGAG